MERPPGRSAHVRGPAGLGRHPGGRVAVVDSPHRCHTVSTMVLLPASRQTDHCRGQRLADSHLTSPIAIQVWTTSLHVYGHVIEFSAGSATDFDHRAERECPASSAERSWRRSGRGPMPQPAESTGGPVRSRVPAVAASATSRSRPSAATRAALPAGRPSPSPTGRTGRPAGASRTGRTSRSGLIHSRSRKSGYNRRWDTPTSRNPSRSRTRPPGAKPGGLVSNAIVVSRRHGPRRPGSSARSGRGCSTRSGSWSARGTAGGSPRRSSSCRAGRSRW